MKTLVIYYSYEGNTRFVAERIQTALEADLLELKLRDDVQKSGLSKYIWGGRQVLTNAQPALLPFDVNFDEYDFIFIGTPVWAGSFAPALRTFLSENPLTGKTIALFCCSGGGKGKVFEKLKAALPGNTFVGELELINPTQKDFEYTYKKLEDWLDRDGLY